MKILPDDIKIENPCDTPEDDMNVIGQFVGKSTLRKWYNQVINTVLSQAVEVDMQHTYDCYQLYLQEKRLEYDKTLKYTGVCFGEWFKQFLQEELQKLKTLNNNNKI